MKYAKLFFPKTAKLIIIFLLCGLNQLSYAQQKRNVTFSKSSFEITTLKVEDGNDYQKLGMNDLQFVDEPGKPNLPVKYLRLLIPQFEDVDNIVIKINEKETIKLSGKVFPTQPGIPTSVHFKGNEFVKPDPSVYDSEQPYPSEIVKISRDGHFDGTNHIVTLAIYPVRYYPQKDYIEFYSNIEFTLQMKNSSRQTLSVRNRHEKYRELYENVLLQMVDNKEDVPALSQSKSFSKSSAVSSGPLPAYEYVIITSNALSGNFEKFMDWKRRKGLDIGLVTVEQIYANYTGDLTSGINDNAGCVREYLKDSWGDGNVWALLGGDYTVVPIRYGAGSDNCDWNNYDDDSAYRIPTDLYFADFDGDWDVDGTDGDGAIRYGERTDDSPDYEPEIFVGRLLCTTAGEISTWTDKVLLYEQDPGRGSTAYLTRSFMFESDQMQRDNEAESVESILTSFSHEIWRELPSYSSTSPTFPTGAEVIDEMNSTRYGLWSWFGHGEPVKVNTTTEGVNVSGGLRHQISPLDAMATGIAETGN